jgi:hypothetical protein
MTINWNEIRRRFDPLAPATPEDVARIYAERPAGLTSDLIDCLRPETSRRTCLLTGQRSSGKTTELLRVMNELRTEYVIVAVDLAAVLPERFGILDVLFALGASLYRTAEEIEPGQLDRHLYTDLIAGMGESVRAWVEKREAGFAVPALAKSLAVLAVGFVAGPGVAASFGNAADKALEALSLKQAEVTEVERRFKEPPRPAEVLRCVTAIIEALENQVARRPLLLLADGLDVFPRQARPIAEREDILSVLPCRAAFVAPPDLRIALDAPALQKVELVGLPNLPVTDPYGAGDLPDITLKFFDELVTRRLPEGLARQAIIEEGELSRLAKRSGGVVRDFVRMVYHACGLAGQKSKSRLDRECVDHGAAQLAQAYGERAAVANVSDMLKQVAERHALPGGPDALDLIHHNLVLLYRLGGRTWYDVHPIVREGLGG